MSIFAKIKIIHMRHKALSNFISTRIKHRKINNHLIFIHQFFIFLSLFIIKIFYILLQSEKHLFDKSYKSL